MYNILKNKRSEFSEYLLAFTIASSFFSFFSFFYFVNKKINEGSLNTNYFNYTIIMPLWFGILNSLSVYLKKKFKLTDRTRFIIISLVGLSVLFFVLNTFQVYNYNEKQMINHVVGVSLFYFFIWNVVIQGIEKLINNEKFNKTDININIVSFLSVFVRFFFF